MFSRHSYIFQSASAQRRGDISKALFSLTGFWGSLLASCPTKLLTTENHGRARTPAAEWMTQNKFAAQIPMGWVDISNPCSFKNLTTFWWPVLKPQPDSRRKITTFWYLQFWIVNFSHGFERFYFEADETLTCEWSKFVLILKPKVLEM